MHWQRNTELQYVVINKNVFYEDINQQARSWCTMAALPSPRDILTTNRHSLRTDGQAGEEEEEVKGGDTKSQAPKTVTQSECAQCKNTKEGRRQ